HRLDCGDAGGFVPRDGSDTSAFSLPTATAGTDPSNAGNSAAAAKSICATVDDLFNCLGGQCAPKQYDSFQPRQVVRDHRQRVAGYDRRAGADCPHGITGSLLTL